MFSLYAVLGNVVTRYIMCSFLCLLSPWLILKYHSLLVTVAESNGGGDHPIPAVGRRYCCYCMVWQALFSFSLTLLIIPTLAYNVVVLYISSFISLTSAPLIGWLADVKFGRYEVIKYGSLSSFLASISYYFAMFIGGSVSTLSTVFSSVAIAIVSLGFTCYSAAMLPFITDQIIGATSDELSAVVRWNYWAQNVGSGLL